jgi:hypothetical protein
MKNEPAVLSGNRKALEKQRRSPKASLWASSPGRDEWPNKSQVASCF